MPSNPKTVEEYMEGLGFTHNPNGGYTNASLIVMRLRQLSHPPKDSGAES